MKRCEDHYRVLLSGYIDDELPPEQRVEIETHLGDCPACQRELDEMRRLFWGTTAAFGASSVPEDAWDEFLDNVYNRLERNTGWAVFIFGAVCLALFGIYVFIREPWTNALVKVLLATPVAGLSILFVSVLRQRLDSVKSDRYTKEVHR